MGTGARVAAIICCLVSTTAAQAQDAGLGISAGLKAWSTHWTTWGYGSDSDGNPAITQSPTNKKTLTIPVLGLRWRDFIASIGGFGSTTFTYPDTSTITRKELDVNVGYYLSPGAAVTLGYKRTGQRAGQNNYELGGPTLGLTATSPLAGGFSVYGLLGLGRLKETGSSNVLFDADYQLSEVGVSYLLPIGGWLRALSFTAGYRMQVINSRDALSPGPRQDARDLTQGFTFGVIGAF